MDSFPNYHTIDLQEDQELELSRKKCKEYKRCYTISLIMLCFTSVCILFVIFYFKDLVQ